MWKSIFDLSFQNTYPLPTPHLQVLLMARPREFDSDQAMQDAMDAFWERGYNATSVNDLLSEMKLNRGSLYGAFGDKKQLFLAAQLLGAFWLAPDGGILERGVDLVQPQGFAVVVKDTPGEIRCAGSDRQANCRWH